MPSPPPPPVFCPRKVKTYTSIKSYRRRPRRRTSESDGCVRGYRPAAAQARNPCCPFFQTWCSQWGTTLPDSTLLTCWTLFSHSEMLTKSYLVRFAYLVSSVMLVMPATNAVSERSFSALTRVKTYLQRSTTGEARLNHLMLLHVHKELADGMDVVEVANLFVGDNHRRKRLFEKFSRYDLPMKSAFVSKATQTV